MIDIDADYQLVAVSETKRECLWILSSAIEVGAKAYDELLARLEKIGFDLKRLEKSKQTKPCVLGTRNGSKDWFSPVFSRFQVSNRPLSQ